MSIITVVSGKGGTGKTFVSVNVACGLKKLGNRVLLIDCCFGTRNIDICINKTSHGIYNLKDWIENVACFKDVMIKGDEDYMPDFVATSLLSAPDNFSEQFKVCISDISDDYDYIIIDTHSSFDSIFNTVVEISDDILAVATEDYFSIVNITSFLSKISDVKQKFFIFNRLGYLDTNDDVYLEDISDESGAKIIGIIREDEYVYKSLKEAKPIVLYDTYSGREFDNICKRILGIYTAPERKSYFFERNRFVLK